MGISAREQAPASPIVRGGERLGRSVIAAAVICAAIGIAALAVSMRGSHDSSARPEAAPVAVDAQRSRLETSVSWVDGLANGLILPSDVTTRLAAQDHEMAEAVMAAWTVLDRSGSGIAPAKAVAWVDGLADGLIRPSDVTTRLAAQDHALGEAVMAAWTHLTG